MKIAAVRIQQLTLMTSWHAISSYTHLFPECAEDLLSWQNGATEESQQISMQGLRF